MEQDNEPRNKQSKQELNKWRTALPSLEWDQEED